MGFILQLYVYLYEYKYEKRKFNKKIDLENEKGARGHKRVKGIRDTLREIDESISKNRSID